MPGFNWLAKATIDGAESPTRCGCCAARHAVYGRGDCRGGREVAGHTELDALVAYLQGLKFHGDSQP